MTPQATPRQMGPLNRVYWYYDQMVNANSCEWIEIDGRLDIGMLDEAAHILARRHPVLNSRLRVGRPWRFEWIEDAGHLPIDIRIERIDVATPAEIHDRLVANIWGERLPLRRGRPFRLHVTELRTTTVLQVVTTHVFTDGHSANLVVRDLVHAYTSLFAGQPWVPERSDIQDRNIVRLFAGGLPAREKRRLTLKAIRDVAREAMTPAGRIGDSRKPRGMTDVIMIDLGADALAGVRRASAGLQISRHPFYVAAAVRAIEDFNARRGIKPKSRLLKIIDNFSLRRHASQNLADFYDLCAIPYSLNANGALDDEALIRDVSRQVETLRGGEILAEVFRQVVYKATAILSPKIMATRMVLSSVVKSNFILSNIGPVPADIERFGSALITAYYSFSQLFPPGQVMFLLSSKGDTLRLICLFDRVNFSRAEIEAELVGGFRQHLDRICLRFGGSRPGPAGAPVAQRMANVVHGAAGE